MVLADTGRSLHREPPLSYGIAHAGTVADIDGNFMLNVDGDPELVISFVGYKPSS